MDRLDIVPKREGDELTAPEWNSSVDKVNEIVDALNGSSAVQRKLYVQNNMEKNFATQGGQPCILDFTFVSQERYSYEEPYENTGERGLCQVSVKNAANTEYAVVKEYYVNSIVSTKLDVAEWLASGANSVMLRISGEITGETTPAYVYNIQLTTLSIEAPNFRWWVAYSNSITVPFLIGGNISKQLFVEIAGVDNSYSAEYNVNIGTATYTETAYNYSIPHPQIEGVYKIRAYITNSDETIQTRSLSFEIMCSMPVSLKKLMCVNNIADSATNWTENVLFDYAIYDGQATNTSAVFTIRKGNDIVFQSTEDSILTNTKHTFSFPMEIETDDDTNFQITVSVEDEGKLTPDMSFEVFNSAGYSAVAGAVLFVNPKTRTNNQANRQSIINEVDAGTIEAAWSGMNWGNDGWQVDDSGTRVLRILAGSHANINYKPFATEAARTGKTIEIDFKTDNVVDGAEAIISMLTPSGASYVGYRIAPDEISMFSQSKRDGTTQHLPIDTGVRIRATMTILPDAYGNSGFNLVAIYINGKKNRVFNYESNDYFAQQGNIVIGSSSADIDIYGVRVYDSALTSEGVHRNYINWLSDNAEKDAEKAANDVLDSHASEIDFLNTADQYNCFVLDVPFPKLTDPSSRVGTLEVYFAGKPQNNFTTTLMNVDGQGTSSKKYWEWNVRMRIDKVPDSITTYADGSTENQQINMFPGITPKMQRITAKKNWASSMQDHKAGSVAAFNDLGKELGLSNVATAANPLVRTAVYQEPFIGFSKQLNEDGGWVYTCMGEFTIGPDKGDVATFDLDKKKYPGMIAIEGADNAPLPALFRVPWNTNLSYMAYNEEEEAWQYNGANSWSLRSGNTANIPKWIAAYNLVYQCSNRLQPYAGTLDELNADIINYRSTGYEYWIAKEGDVNQYNVYYYEAAVGFFIPSDIGQGQINLISQLVDKGYGLTSADLTGKTSDELNALFISARVQKFRQEIGEHFDINDAIFHANFIEFIAGTDNRAKNTYVINYGTDGSLFVWHQDDLDTIFPIDNQGQDKKPYSCEVHDMYENGASVWNGETSNFWNLLELAFPDEINVGMRSMFSAMESLSGMSSGTPYEKIYGFYKKYYLSVKNYFPATIVNADAKRYEDAKLAYIQGIYSNDTDPITQSHGDFFSTETAWVKKRILYMMSKYSYGIFSANGTDIITVRAAGDEIVYDLIPSMDLYPAIASGTSIVRGDRTKAGETCQIVIDLGGAGDQQNNIQGASYLLSIGEWYNKNVSGTMIIQGRRLQEINLGHATEPITISITGLTIANTPSVRKINLKRISTLTGVLDVSSCVHLKEIYADGTSLAQIKLPEGGGLEKVSFPATNTYLMLRNFPMLTSANVDISLCDENITDFYVQDCAMINPIDMLVSVLEAQDAQGSNHALKRVRAVGFDVTYTDTGSYILDMLAKLANGEYVGLNAEGLAGDESYPVFDGKMTVYADVYQDSIDTLTEKFPKLNLTVVGERYVRFIDPEIHRIVVNQWGNGVGVKQSQLDAVTEIDSASLFANNTLIEDASDFGVHFRNLTSITYGVFSGCTNLKKFGFSQPIQFGTNNIGAFSGCSLIDGFDFSMVRPSSMPYGTIFNGNNFVSVHLPTTIADKNGGVEAQFHNCTLLDTFVLGEGILSVWNILQGTTALRKVVFPSTMISVGGGGNGLFGNTYMSKLLFFVVKATTPPTYNNAITGYGIPSAFRIYVPDESIEAYKAASGWSGFASIIVGISTLPEGEL